jgi:hypothetical protein
MGENTGPIFPAGSAKLQDDRRSDPVDGGLPAPEVFASTTARFVNLRLSHPCASARHILAKMGILRTITSLESPFFKSQKFGIEFGLRFT